MKKFLLAVVAVAALVACSGKSGLEKELVGNYTAKPEMPAIVDSTDFTAQMTAALFAQMKMDMNFKDNGTMDMTVTMGTNSQSTAQKWEISADTLIMTDSLMNVQKFNVAKTEGGFTLTSEELTLLLTPATAGAAVAE